MGGADCVELAGRDTVEVVSPRLLVAYRTSPTRPPRRSPAGAPRGDLGVRPGRFPGPGRTRGRFASRREGFLRERRTRSTSTRRTARGRSSSAPRRSGVSFVEVRRGAEDLVDALARSPPARFPGPPANGQRRSSSAAPDVHVQGEPPAAPTETGGALVQRRSSVGGVPSPVAADLARGGRGTVAGPTSPSSGEPRRHPRRGASSRVAGCSAPARDVGFAPSIGDAVDCLG